MRLSRSRISIGADARQLLAAQQIAQNPSLAPKGTKSPELSSVPPPPPVVPALPKAAAQPLVPPPPPPVAVSKTISIPPSAPPPAVIASLVPPPPPQVASELQRPRFKDPAPEFDGFPPRPSFKEPPPESDDLPTRPTFVDPAPENLDVPATLSPPPPPPLTAVIPPTPQKPASYSTARKIASRSPSPPDNGDIVLGTGKSTIMRSGSAQSNTTTTGRGQRLTRGPRAVGGSNVQSLVQSLNRTSISGSPPSSSSVPASPKLNRLSGSPVRPPSSVGRSSFSRRTMISDAEDDVFDKK